MITFENIKTGEKVTFHGGQDPETRSAHMAAYLNSSNLHANSNKGQDFGWRLAPEIVAKMDQVRTSPDKLDQISRNVGVSIDDIRDFHILDFVASQDFAIDAMAAREKERSTVYEEEYNERLKALRENAQPVSNETDSSTQSDSAKLKEPTSTKKEK